MTHLDTLPVDVSGAPDLAALAQRYAVPPGPRAGAAGWVRALMITTLDGRATGEDGRSGTIGTPADLAVLETVRALSDVVVVAAGTVRAEGYTRLGTPPPLARLRTDAGRSAYPVLAVVTASGDLPDRVLDARDDGGELLVLVTERTDTGRLRRRLGPDRVLVGGTEQVDPGRALDLLAARGLADVVCEGGPGLLHQWLACGALDELCLTVRSLLLGGDGPRLLTGAPLPQQARDWRTTQVLAADGDLMLRVRPRG